MTKTIRRVSLVMLLLFGALFVNLNITQMLRAGELVDHPNNRRLLVAEYAIKRGPIVVGEEAIARSSPTDEGDFAHMRSYPEPTLWSHVTGYDSFVVGRSGLEDTQNEDLIGTPAEFLAQNLAQLLGNRSQEGNTIRLTLIPAAQRAAREGLGDRTGAVVALDPVTGAVLAHYSSPTYDPNPLASHDGGEVQDTWETLTTDPANPLLDRAVRELYPPGSTFKVIVAAAALEQGLLPNTAFTDKAVYDVPNTTADITNFSPGPCGNKETITLADALRVSCNTVFAELGVELGPDVLHDQAQRFGFNRTPPYDLPVVDSQFRLYGDNEVPELAQSSIGERDVRATALQQALMAAAIANEGRLPRPYIVRDVLDPTNRVIEGPREGPWVEGAYRAQAVSEQTASLLRAMMVDVVKSGTGTRAAIDGVEVGGKTGTASVPNRTPTVWFVGFADDDVAVAVVLPEAGDGATGGRQAAPIAREVMRAVLNANA